MVNTTPSPSIDAPDRLYKYRSAQSDLDLERLEEIVLHNKIFFSSPKSFNDPFDCRPAFDFSGSAKQIRNEHIRLIKKFDPSMNRRQRRTDASAMLKDPARDPRCAVVQHTIQDQYNEEMNRIGVLCVSEVNDDILMWSHYANSHAGVCLEFDGFGTFMERAQKVIYTRKRPSIPQFDRADPVEMLDRGLLTKSEHWQYEKEWRLIRYQKGFGKVEFRPENLQGLILGALTPSPMVQKIRQMLSKRRVPLKLYQAKISRTAFELSIDLLK